SLVDSIPACKIADRVSAEAVAKAVPEAIAAILLRPNNAAPIPPAMARLRAQRCCLPGRPVCSGSASAGCMGSVRFWEKYRSAAVLMVASARAGRVCCVGVVTIGIRVEAIAAEETKRYKRLS